MATQTTILGFSAGGLSSLLLAPPSPSLAIWDGFDPLDRDDLVVKAVTMVQAHTVVLSPEPSSCNAHGNAQGIVSALPLHDHFRIVWAVHVGAEWPTSWLAEFVCGRFNCKSNAGTCFATHATKVLLLGPGKALQVVQLPQIPRRLALLLSTGNLIGMYFNLLRQFGTPVEERNRWDTPNEPYQKHGISESFPLQKRESPQEGKICRGVRIHQPFLA